MCVFWVGKGDYVPLALSISLSFLHIPFFHSFGDMLDMTSLQDTNSLVFNAIPTALGVSKDNNLDVNSLCVPRKGGEAIGAICQLKREASDDGGQAEEMTINVEYNQLEPLLKANGFPEGDVNDPKTGYSCFPGNINQLIIKLDTYVPALEKSKGVRGPFF